MRKESTESRSESRPEWEQLEDWVPILTEVISDPIVATTKSLNTRPEVYATTDFYCLRNG